MRKECAFAGFSLSFWNRKSDFLQTLMFWLFGLCGLNPILFSEGVLVSRQGVSGFPETGADLWGGAGNFQGEVRELPEKSGKLLGNLWITLKSGKKKEPKPKLFGPDIFGWGGGFARDGVGAKKFGMSFETQGYQTFWRDIPVFAGISRGRPKSLRKKGLCSILVPY